MDVSKKIKKSSWNDEGDRYSKDDLHWSSIIMELSQSRNLAFNKFNQLLTNPLLCPALWIIVKFTHEWFSHITYKDEKHRRNDKEQMIRFTCFLDVGEILTKSHLYQEYREREETLKVRKYGKTTKEIKKAEYFWFVGVVECWTEKHRVRVVIRKEQGKEYAEYHSVMPAWNMQWYRNFMGSLE